MADSVLAGHPGRADYSGDCLSPVPVRFAGWSWESGQTHANFAKRASGEYLIAFVACRRCFACLERRKNKWGARGHAETIAAYQTWFVTLTLGPAYRGRLDRMIDDLSEWHISNDDLPIQGADARFIVSAEAVGRDLTLFIKRLRKRGHKLRYVAALEAHKDGVPHVHALLHFDPPGLPVHSEIVEHVRGSISVPVANRLMADCWGHGFTQTKGPIDREDAHPAFYVAKYLAKTHGQRVRASSGYGRRGL